MSIEKRRYPRFYFKRESLPQATIIASDQQNIFAEVLNISAGGLCLSMKHTEMLSSEQLARLCLKEINLSSLSFLKNVNLKICYFFRVPDLKKIVYGIEFQNIDEKCRHLLHEFVQKNARQEIQNS